MQETKIKRLSIVTHLYSIAESDCNDSAWLAIFSRNQQIYENDTQHEKWLKFLSWNTFVV